MSRNVSEDSKQIPVTRAICALFERFYYSLIFVTIDCKINFWIICVYGWRLVLVGWGIQIDKYSVFDSYPLNNLWNKNVSFLTIHERENSEVLHIEVQLNWNFLCYLKSVPYSFQFDISRIVMIGFEVWEKLFISVLSIDKIILVTFLNVSIDSMVDYRFIN